MKKYLKFSVLIVALTVLSMGFSSCSDDDINSIVGVWTFVNMTADIQNPTNPKAAEEEMLEVGFASAISQGSTYRFKTDNTFIYTIVGMSQKGTYTRKGDKYILTANEETVEGELKNGILTIISDELDEYYREDGFTKYVIKMTFKK